jgi:hypothetical protein
MYYAQIVPTVSNGPGRAHLKNTTCRPVGIFSWQVKDAN